jgi:hypothetical protein
MRLNEVALRSWDVRVAVYPAATLSEESAEVVVEQFTGELSFMLGFLGKADALAAATVVDAHGHGLVVADGVSLSPTADNATATFVGPLEAFVRLIGGRLTPARTPDTVSVVGHVSLDDLRRVFPGFKRRGLGAQRAWQDQVVGSALVSRSQYGSPRLGSSVAPWLGPASPGASAAAVQ